MTDLNTAYAEYAELTDKIRRLADDKEATATLIEEFDRRTLDGVPIRMGMEVWDYNMKQTTIVGIQSLDYDPTGKHTPWFATDNGGMFDAGRLWARRPW